MVASLIEHHHHKREYRFSFHSSLPLLSPYFQGYLQCDVCEEWKHVPYVNDDIDSLSSPYVCDDCKESSSSSKLSKTGSSNSGTKRKMSGGGASVGDESGVCTPAPSARKQKGANGSKAKAKSKGGVHGGVSGRGSMKGEGKVGTWKRDTTSAAVVEGDGGEDRDTPWASLEKGWEELDVNQKRWAWLMLMGSWFLVGSGEGWRFHIWKRKK